MNSNANSNLSFGQAEFLGKLAFEHPCERPKIVVTVLLDFFEPSKCAFGKRLLDLEGERWI